MPVRALVSAAVIASTSIAAADGNDASDTREAAMLATFTPVSRADLGFRWQADALAAALATSQHDDAQVGGAATVSAEAGVTAAKDCDLVAAGGQVSARSDEHAVAAQQWGSVCLLGGDGHIALDHRLEWDVTPRLLAAPRLRPGLQRRETIGLDIYGSTRPLHDPGSSPDSQVPVHDWIQGGQARLETQVGWSDRDDGGDVRVLFDIVLRNFRFDHDSGPPTQVAIVAPRMEVATGAGPGAPFAGGLAGDLARVEGYRLAGLRFGGRLGGHLGGIAEGSGPATRQTLIVVGEGGVSVERDLARGVTVRLGGDRQGWADWDARYVIDDRATWSLLASRGRLHARLDVAAALEHVLSIGHRDDVPTGGVTLAAALDLGHDLALEAHGEAGRSVYARDAALDAPRWASETLLMLATHLHGH
jgi:hypothetical protein